MASHALSALRALTFRLSSTPTAQLPHCVAQLSASIWTCRELLSTPADSLKRSASDDGAVAVVVHRLRTQLTALLQDRTVEGRWAAVVLVKAVVEAGGLETLSKCNTWVRSLLAILKKPDPPTTRALAVVVLTRIFTLTWDHVSLVREITTPALPAFVSTCLGNATNKHCSPDELLNILGAFEVLLPHHPTIFRTNESVLRAFLLRVTSNSQDTAYTSDGIAVALRVLALLPYVAPKQGSAEKWSQSVQSLVESAHQTCDQVFKPIIEPTGSHHARVYTSTSTVIGTRGDDPAGLMPWTGVPDGAVRLSTLLQAMTAHFEATTHSPVNVSIGQIFDLLSRILSVTVPYPGKHSFTKANPEITREERDLLFTALPSIHISAFALLAAIVDRFGLASISLLSACYDHAIEVSAAEDYHVELRAVVYDFVVQLLKRDGLACSKERISQLSALLRKCCQDSSSAESSLSRSAAELLTVSLTIFDARHIPRNLRTVMDRTAVLSRNKNALLASVLNPAPNPSSGGLQTSLLPILARLYPDEPQVEALIRPRMPVSRAGNSKVDDDLDDGNPMREDDELEDLQDVISHISQPYEEPETTLEQTGSSNAQDNTAAFQEYMNNQLKRAQPTETNDEHDLKRQRASLDKDNHARSDDKLSDGRGALVNTEDYSRAGIADRDVSVYEEDESDIEMPPLTLEPDTDEDSS